MDEEEYRLKEIKFLGVHPSLPSPNRRSVQCSERPRLRLQGDALAFFSKMKMDHARSSPWPISCSCEITCTSIPVRFLSDFPLE